MSGPEKAIQGLLDLAGVKINGPEPTDIQVHNPSFYSRVFSGGSLALGESYMDGWWDVEDMAGSVSKILKANLEERIRPSLAMIFYFVRSWLFNLQNRARADEVAVAHYDIGNDLYSKMLGPSMVYTCGYWKDTDDLTIAQYNKLDLVCKKIGLKKGDHILDIGCGFGSFAKFAAERYGASVVGISLSKEQIVFAKEFTKGLPVEIRYQDYRELKDEQFDHVVSIGMFEAVGYRNFRVFMQKAYEVLKPGGFFLLHTIGGNRTVVHGDPWMDKYIFPNGMLPSIAQLGASIEQLFVMEDWHNFGANYDLTLMAWFKNFNAAWPTLKDAYGERFYRMWKFYLLTCAAAFRTRHIELWQIVLSKNGVPGGYTSVR